MGNIIKNKKIYSDEIKSHHECIINCDSNGIVLEVSDRLARVLDYYPNELVGNFIGMIMSPFISFLHKKILIPKYKKLSVIERNTVNLVLSGFKYKRPLIIYTKNKKAIYVNLYIGVNDFINSNRTSGTTFIVTFDILPEPENSIVYTPELEITKRTGEFKSTVNKIVIVSIDFKDSTKLLVDNGNSIMIGLYKNFHNDVIDLIKSKYYPYIYIHEIVGDCFVIVSNIDWTHNMPKYCASLMVTFIYNLFNLTNKYISIRIGIAYGNLHWGYIDHNLRLFGIPMNMAARLENVCPDNSICCDENFFNKLGEENMCATNDIEYTNLSANLKGLGQTNYYCIQLDSKKNTNVFDACKKN